MTHLDHILYIVPNLETGIKDFEFKSGVTPIYGGKHKKLGTHNAIVSLDDKFYLELIAPDPSQSIPFKDIIYDIGKIQNPRILTWALRSNDLPQLSKNIQTTEITPGERLKGDGSILKWETVGITEIEDDSGIVPFVINWLSKPHPAQEAQSPCKLLEFNATHPTPQIFTPLFSKLNFPFNISEDSKVQLTAKIQTPKGIIEF